MWLHQLKLPRPLPVSQFCVKVMEGDDSGSRDWVEAEIEEGLAGLAHLELEDLEEEEEDGCHGNEVW